MLFKGGGELTEAQRGLLSINNAETRKSHEDMEYFAMSSPEYAHSLLRVGIEYGLQRGFAHVDSLYDGKN